MHELIDMQNEPEVEDTLLTPEQRAYLAGFKAESDEDEKAIRWEALREQCMTIGTREALDRAMKKGNILIDYLWFILVVGMLIIALHKWAEGCDDRDPAADSHIPAEVKGGHGEGLR